MVEFIFKYPLPQTGFAHSPIHFRRHPPKRIDTLLPMVIPFYLKIARTGTLTGVFMNLTIEETQIVKAVLHGDADEFRILVERYQKPVYNFMLRITRVTMTAEDLTQDVFERAYAKLHTFKSGKRFFPWLYTIAVNAGRDHLRKKGVRHDIFDSESTILEWADNDTEGCVKRLDCIMDASRVSDALDRLPLKYSEPMLLYYREGFTVKEIAAALRISLPSVKIRIHRGRELLKAAIGANDVTS